MNYYIGNIGADSPLGTPKFRYFYALRVNEDGELFLTKIDQWTEDFSLQINNPGNDVDNWDFFEVGFDYFDNVDPVTKNKEHKNLSVDQYRFDERSVFYYIDEDGNLVLRIGRTYDYSQNN